MTLKQKRAIVVVEMVMFTALMVVACILVLHGELVGALLAFVVLGLQIVFRQVFMRKAIAEAREAKEARGQPK